ncbi:MAG: FAD binding domain-containing protein [Bacteroidota bacterium]|nr:FAD binding domain-containing protein [Bacteroidota bacterium]
MIQFILNNKEVSTDLPPGSLLLDFIRYQQRLTGTKIGCREGDCGACTVLIGELKIDRLQYRSFTSCLTPLGNIYGKHVVTIEGINLDEMNAIQQTMADASATQCGFCTPGFVMSLASFCLSGKESSCENAVAAIDGNICRCTGYKSIERAAQNIAAMMQQRSDQPLLQFIADNHILPRYFLGIKDQLKNVSLPSNGQLNQNQPKHFAGGGTDLYVQRPGELKDAEVHFMYNKDHLKVIGKEGNTCFVGPSATVTDLQESEIIQQYFPRFNAQVKLISSTPIRNMATIAGNLINASPIGDFTIFFLALDATVVLSDGNKKRELPLRQLYKGYKSLNKSVEEFIEKIWFELPEKETFFNFEKVSKRTHLDIASVNSALSITVAEGFIKVAHLSAGGVGPIPMFLKETSLYLQGKPINEDVIARAISIADREVSPISDARGTATYKRLLLGQLIKAHFLTLFPHLQVEKLLSLPFQMAE